MSNVEALSFAIVIAAAVSYLLWLLPGPCKCEKCAFHTNERRVKHLEEEHLRIEEAEKQAVLRHDLEHKGAAWMNGDPDRFNCHDAKCPRNRHRKLQ